MPRITSLQTYEHIGCLEWLPTASGTIEPTGQHELGVWFCPNSNGMIRSLEAADQRDGIASTVVRPFIPIGQRFAWPGEGTYWYVDAGLNDGNFITGPYGLITADLDTTGMVDYTLMRNKAMSALKTTMELAEMSTSDLAVLPAG